MAIKTIQSTFSGGAISPNAFGRKDLEVYSKSAAEIDNAYVDSIGWVRRREGLKYLGVLPQSSRFLPFNFNNEQRYLLVFSAGKMDVYKNDSFVVSVTSSPISTLTFARISEMDYTQAADTLILVHPDFAPIKITRTSDTVWTAAAITFSFIPFYAYSTPTITNPVATIAYTQKTGRAKLTLGAEVAGSSWVGQRIYFGKGGVLRITEFVSTTSVWAAWVVEPPDTTTVASGDWELESGYEPVWSATKGYPLSATFHQNRLVFGGSKGRKTAVWFSVIDDFFNFDLGSSLDDEAIEIDIFNGELNPIKFIHSGVTLQIFTTLGEWYIPVSTTEPIMPSNVSVKQSTSHGISCKPTSFDGSVLFSDASGYILHQFIYNDLEQTFNSPNISILSPHLINGITKIVRRNAVSYNANNLAYMLNADNSLTVLNSLREQDFRAFSSFSTDGVFLDMETIGSDIYFKVKRTVGATSVYFLEKLDPLYLTDASKKATSLTDTSSWTGFDHLDGFQCSVIADSNYVLSDVTPDSGAFVSDVETKNIEAGLFFAPKIVLLPIDFTNANNGASIGDIKRLAYLNVQMKDSRGIVAKAFNITYSYADREFGASALDSIPPLSNGWKKIFLGGYGRDTDLTITQEQPNPFNVLSITVGAK